MNQAISLPSPFTGLESLKGQLRALRSLSYIDPKGCIFGTRLDSILDPESLSRVPHLVMETFHYVSPIDVLELVLSSKDVRIAILSEQPSEDGILGSFIDGEIFKNHAFLQKFRHAIRLVLYYDELEIVNCVGSKTGIHKLGIFYFKIDNLPPHMNSELSSIHVLLISCYEDVKRYDLDQALAPFMQDLAKLESEEGVKLVFDDEMFILCATVITLCGDSLAGHEVMNLMGLSANYFCRKCMYSRCDLHEGSTLRAQ
ncbi:hypothetical protein QAD02_011705 [Eretmocerus hayati]|uniref:Uncharacterized protein n=1 Tax=Eretmocerus hayati TaxID=131215 RepID=A0ACC2P067_9HYME|nr:hypothetical protein QAD02_011705 [Eretmocerus hayati]